MKQEYDQKLKRDYYYACIVVYLLFYKYELWNNLYFDHNF